VRRPRRRRRRFSINGLAIQLSAFALSFTLVALLVVSGSQAAFVEENETVTAYVPVETASPSEGRGRPARGTPAVGSEIPPPTEDAVPTVAPATAESTPLPAIDVPAVAVERCIEVTYAGAVDPEPVRLYAATTTGDLAPYLDLTIHVGQTEAGAFSSCSGFVPTTAIYAGTLAAFSTAHATYATGRPTWDPATTGESRAFRFRLSVHDDPLAAGKSATFGFSWRTEAP
jgi:hypothetical protein